MAQLMAYGIPKTLTWTWKGTLMLTGLGMQTIGKAVMGDFYVGTNLVAWMSKKQNSIALYN